MPSVDSSVACTPGAASSRVGATLTYSLASLCPTLLLLTRSPALCPWSPPPRTPPAPAHTPQTGLAAGTGTAGAAAAAAAHAAGTAGAAATAAAAVVTATAARGATGTGAHGCLYGALCWTHFCMRLQPVIWFLLLLLLIYRVEGMAATFFNACRTLPCTQAVPGWPSKTPA